MTGGTIALGITFAALCIVLGVLIGWPIAYRRGLRHAAEEAGWQRTDARWKGLADAMDQPVPVRPPVPETPRDGPGKHRHPAGPPQHAASRPPVPEAPRPALPRAGYLAAPDGMGPWDGTITVTAPAQAPPWDIPPAEPRTEVLEPTAVLPRQPETDTAWTRRMAKDMDAWIAEHITATDPVLKEITGGAR